tara:strand:- start:7366 stop:8040 length:675 start_codon:yes stop_codon:yes gene_type:complete
LPIWLNFDSKKAVIARFKCGSSSTRMLTEIYGWKEYNFSMNSAVSLDDDYTMLKNTGTDLKKGWDVFFIARDPVAYTLSGYRNFYAQYKNNYEYAKKVMDSILVNNYSFADHVNIVSDVFLHSRMRRWMNYEIFLSHCVSIPINHWRPWMNLIKIEKDFANLHSYVGIETPFPHINESDRDNIIIKFNDHTVNQLKSRWFYTANQWGYNLDESIEQLKDKYLNK